MSRIYLPEDASRARMRDAENARRNRADIVKARSWGQVSRRDLLKWGLFTSAGLLAPIGGLNPFVGNVGAAIPTGTPRSPLFGAKEFSQVMPRFDVLPRYSPSTMSPLPSATANQTQQPVPDILGGGTGPIEGRPPGDAWAHQKFAEFAPQVCFQVTQQGARTNTTYNPGVPSSLNSGIKAGSPMPVRFHSKMPIQDVNSVWTFNGTAPPKLAQVRYGEPSMLRHYNGLPYDVTKNNGFGRHTISTHEHNGHHGAENDGFTGAYFFPGQFYDYHWPVVLAGHFSMNSGATEPFASTPDGKGGLIQIKGDWHETMSTHWFHDHMFSFTSQNVYKGNFAMMNIYSGLDRGNEGHADGVNLCLPSGSAKDWGNLDYDVNLAVQDVAFDANGQLFFDIFEFDGFLGDVMTVNMTYKPYFEVEKRKYRFRILNACTSRFLKVALADAKTGSAQPIVQIGNDGNLLPGPVSMLELDEQGTAERYDIVIDFSKYPIGSKLHLVNLAEHQDGRLPARDVTLAEALSGASLDPGVGRFLEFRVARYPSKPDVSRVPGTLIPNPDLSQIPVARVRNFVFGRDGIQPSSDPVAAFIGPWAIGTNGGSQLEANFNRISAAPQFGTREVWNLINGGGGWDHPIHIHFEEGVILNRDDGKTPVPAWEQGRKDVYRLRPGGSVAVSIQFRDWGGAFMEHCHNTVHEDNAMLLRWEIDTSGSTTLVPLPTPNPTPQGVLWDSNAQEIL